MSTLSLAERAMRAVLARHQAAPLAPPMGTAAEAAGPESRPAPPSAFNSSALDAELPDVAPDAFAPQKILQLARWPRMRELPADDLVATAHILALLAHGPSAGFLVHRRLNLPREVVMPLLFRLHAEGCLRVAGGGPAGATAAITASAVEHEPAAEAAPAAPPSIWNKLLRKLRA